VPRPEGDDENGAVNYWLAQMQMDDDMVQATAKTARLFLGMQVQCTQCHNHPFNDWKQQKYWEMNAFFRQTAALRRFADEEGCSLIVTTGGTGPAPRDVTPEATEAVCGKLLPGFGELMRSASLKVVPTAILSRQTAGVRGRCLVVNLPGKPKAIPENLSAVFPATPYAIDLVGGARLETDPAKMPVFRP